MEEATAAERKFGYYEGINPTPSMSPEERATLMNEEGLEYLQQMDATVFHRPDLLVGHMEEEIEQSQCEEALSESRSPVHGRASSPTPYFWYMPLFLLASLAFLYCFGTSRVKRAAGKRARARITRYCEKFSSVPFYILLLSLWWYPELFQPPQFLEPTRTMLQPSFPLWFRDFSNFMLVLSIAFAGKIVLACSKLYLRVVFGTFKEEIALECSVLWLRFKGRWDGRNPKNNLAVEAIARQRESRGSQRKEKEQGKNGKKNGNRSAPPVAKTDEHSTPQEAKPQLQDVNRTCQWHPRRGRRKTTRRTRKITLGGRILSSRI